jgi:nucleoside-diphosphate-sugar epimerase
MAKILITGGTGCIGAITTHKLLESKEVEKIIIASRSNNLGIMNFWFHGNLDPRLEFIKLDVGDAEAIEKTLPEINPTHIVHLGAFQSPDCAKYHERGMQINVGGTMALFDAAENLPNLKKFVFASSAAVYGMRAMYPEDIIYEDARLAPPNHYGIWKLAGEHLGRLFYDNTKIPTICLRLNTTYGKGREQGKTSAPTNAMKAVALGSVKGELISFEMPYTGRENYHFVEDVGAHFAACTLQEFDGFGAFNIKGETIAISSFLNIVKEEAEKLGMGDYVDLSIVDNADPNLFISDLSHEKIEGAFKNLPRTEIAAGVSKSLQEFIEMAKTGTLYYPEKN